jgi:hypothetical protein
LRLILSFGANAASFTVSSLPFTRRSFLRITAGAAVAALAADAAILEPNHPRLVNIDLPLVRLPEAWNGFRIAQLSDFHYDPYFSVIPLRKAVEILNPLKPDLIVLTGDFVTVPVFAGKAHRPAFAAGVEPCSEILARMQAASGLFACLGNHDAGTDAAHITSTLQARGIQVLRNRSLPLQRNGSRLWISGVDDVLEGQASLDLALRGIPVGEPVLLLAHEPDFALQTSRRPVDLQLSGHSHGGQIRIPFVGAPYLPELGRRFPRGMYKIGRLTLYTNVGIGTIRVPLRFDCPPEITLFTLRSPAAGAA